ncbi:MAG: hypothetical protein SXA11_01920 [Cyanobacteriota bacterium]|nr:hypothetical protein [Cyanobacteriota bacterium]
MSKISYPERKKSRYLGEEPKVGVVKTNGKNSQGNEQTAKPEAEIDRSMTSNEYKTSAPTITSEPSEERGPAEESKFDARETETLAPKTGFWTWQLIWWAIVAGLGMTGAAALLWLFVTPPPPNCEQISPLSADSERLYCAHKAAESKNLEELQEAIALVETWEEDHPLYSQAQQMTAEWTKLILSVANQKINEGDLQGALDTVGKIPKTSPIYSRVEDRVALWEAQWKEGQLLYDQSLKAIAAMDWKKASVYALAMSGLDNVHWQKKRFKELLEKMAIEKRAWEKLKDARYLVYRETAEEYKEALALANQIPRDLYMWKNADKDMSEWAGKLLAIATKKIEQKDLEGAIAVTNFIPSNYKFYPQGQNLILLGHAKAAIWNQSAGVPGAKDFVTLVEGKAAAAKIKSNSPYYKEAQARLQEIATLQENLKQLQLASALANVGQPFALELAVEQAQMVGRDEPKRIQAQSLIARWRKEILSIEDRPYLTAARDLATQQTVEGLNEAIEQASYVALGRPLRIEAQTLIAEWKKRIQIIEDGPFLAEARTLAKEGKVNEAIDAANKIAKGRALYAEAQQEIDKWITEQQIAQDQPILNRAYNLAAQGSLTAAINTAYQISYGRALYYEAQGAISKWSAEREAIWAEQEAARQRQYYQPAPAPQYYNPAPAPQYYAPAPAPAPQYYDPAPSQSYYEPAPQYYAPAPAPQYYNPAPAPQYYAPAPAPQYYEPEPSYSPPGNDAYLLQE